MSIEKQLELERRMSERGRENYRKSVQAAETGGRGHETQASQRLIREFIEPLAAKLEDWCNVSGPGKNGLFRPLLRTIDPHVAMYLALCSLFDYFTMDASVASLAIKIGGMVEDDLRFTAFRDQHAKYYDEIMQDMRRKGVKSYRHKHRVLTHQANQHEDSWIKWAPNERLGVGMKLLDIILEHTDLVRKVQRKVVKKGQRPSEDVRLVPTEYAEDWIREHHAIKEMLFPDRLPCIIEPDNWTDLDQGGYYSAELRNTTKLIKTVNGEHRKFISRRFRKNKQGWLQSINHLQKTPWTVNYKVLEVVQEVWSKNLCIGMPAKEPLVPPPSPVQGIEKADMTEVQQELLAEWKQEASLIYTLEKERIAKSFQLARVIRMAQEFKEHDRFWYVWTFDFRGRMYTATNGFSPQGPDFAKGMLKFANGKALGERGLYWLKVNIANRFGYDKEDYDDRVRWVEAQHDKWMYVAADPINARDIWKGADKPYQFLAAVFEYAEALLSGAPESYVSHLPIGLDGSCNGLQNFSAMLRDSVGGAATNLTPQSKPADIYAQVGAVCGSKILAAANAGGTDADYRAQMVRWSIFLERYGKQGALPRKLPKRPVMTLPYGATRQSCTKYIYTGMLEIDTNSSVFPTAKFGAACALTPLMWESIGEVVVAAREAMDWLQKCARVIGKTNSPVYWDTPDGFPVWQAEYKQEELRVRTQLAGDFRVKLRPYTDDICSRTMSQSISPNFVHSYDANHLRATVRKCFDNGITDLACIHDDYGTHAADTDRLHRYIREAFVWQYTDHDPLVDFANWQEMLGYDLPVLPPKGDLDINKVLQSEYFFG